MGRTSAGEPRRRTDRLMHTVYTERPWRKEMTLMCAAMIVFVVAGWALVRDHANQIRDASFENCVRQRLALQSARTFAEQANQGLRSISPNQPLSRASLRVIEERQAIRQQLAEQIPNCEELYP